MNYIRRMENRAADLYRLRLINGFLHLYAGQVWTCNRESKGSRNNARHRRNVQLCARVKFERVLTMPRVAPPQEAVVVGLRMAMHKEDTVITAYRCHGFAVAFDIPARAILAELMGRKTGASKGKGGSMHMYAPNFYGGDGIVGGQVDRSTACVRDRMCSRIPN